MSVRTMRARLDRLGPPPPPEGAYCLHHGLRCRLGAEEPLELEHLVYEAHRRCGRPAVSPYEHKLATPQQRAKAEQELADLIAQKHAENERELAYLRGETETLEDQ